MSRRRQIGLVTTSVLVAALVGPLALVGAPASAAPVAQLTGFASDFFDPPTSALPTARYWVASGVGDPADVASDISAMAANSIGSVTYDDVVLFQSYDVTKSFGTPAWSNKLRAALEVANSEQMRVDLLISPGWSASSDRIGPDDPGASKALRHGRSAVLSGNEASRTFSGQVPLSPLAGGVTKRALQGVIGVQCSVTCSETPTRIVRSSVVDLTNTVTGSSLDGSGQGLNLDWTAPDSPTGSSWLVLAFWSQGNGLRPIATTDASLRNAYQVDHFSVAGAQALIDPWNEQVLDDNLRDLIRENAGSMWLDSIELWDTNWTDSFMDEYTARTGRSFVAGLPTVSTAGDLPSHPFGFSVTPFLYDDNSNELYRYEWSRQLSDLFIRDHIRVLKEWAAGLGLKLRYQAYSTTGPVEAVIPDEAWPELDIMDAEAADSRAIAAVGAMAGKRVNSQECCAFIGETWGQRWTDFLFRVNESFSTGANALEYHGYVQKHGGLELTGAGNTVSWPGWSPMGAGYGVGESWDPRQPSWEDEGGINRYIGRNQLVLQTGQLRSDFAVYTNGTFAGENQAISNPAVADRGYSWGYMADKFVAEAEVRDGILYPDGPQYRALVLDRQAAMPLASGQKILSFAQAGVPVIILGQTPTLALGAPDNPQASSDLVAVMSELKDLHNVILIPGDSASIQALLPTVLAGLGIQPLTRPADPVTLQTITRQDGATTYYFLFNRSHSGTVNTTLTLAQGGRPYALDAWTGAITPIAVYETGTTTISVAVDLLPGETSIIAVTTDESQLGATALPISFAVSDGDVIVDNGQVAIRSTSPGTVRSTTQEGIAIQTDVSGAPASFTPQRWTLNVESWDRPTSGVDSLIQALTSIELSAGTDGSLPSWLSINSPVDLRTVSGLGTYSTSFELNNDWNTSLGAILDLGPNFQTYSVVVNGHEVQGEDQLDSRVDLGRYLVAGENTLEVRVSTTLRNAVLARATNPNRGGLPANTEPQPYGLVGPITITPYRVTPVPPLPLDSAPTPTITGTAQVGATLTAIPGAWSPAPVNLAYQWFRGNTAISGATAPTYVVQEADRGSVLSVQVTGSKSGYETQTRASAPTAQVPTLRPPTDEPTGNPTGPTPPPIGEYGARVSGNYTMGGLGAFGGGLLALGIGLILWSRRREA